MIVVIGFGYYCLIEFSQAKFGGVIGVRKHKFNEIIIIRLKKISEGAKVLGRINKEANKSYLLVDQKYKIFNFN